MITKMHERIEQFFFMAIPSIELLIWLFPVVILYTILSAAFVAYLKKQDVRTAYTRKIFHLFIFSAAALLQLLYGLPAVVILGCVVSTAVLFAVYKGDGYLFYEAMARPSDFPKRSLFILIPLLTTALGGILSNIFFLQYASVGYLIGGFGDAIGEPAGAKWGRHWYKVPSLAGVKARRSLEGSTAVFIVSIVAGFIILLFMNFPADQSIKTALICAVGATLVEAVSTHGLDNLTIQIAGSGLAYWSLA